nr:RNA-directed DNA polymerase, eukaryota, reverse transcriptase zinc-binding domain protein [Tanacetum cinerariifolium]
MDGNKDLVECGEATEQEETSIEEVCEVVTSSTPCALVCSTNHLKCDEKLSESIKKVNNVNEASRSVHEKNNNEKENVNKKYFAQVVNNISKMHSNKLEFVLPNIDEEGVTIVKFEDDLVKEGCKKWDIRFVGILWDYEEVGYENEFPVLISPQKKQTVEKFVTIKMKPSNEESKHYNSEMWNYFNERWEGYWKRKANQNEVKNLIQSEQLKVCTILETHVKDVNVRKKNEIKEALKSIDDNKAPGLDGEDFRMKKVLYKIVSKNQSAFIPGRSITDNILLTQELLKGYGSKRGKQRCTFKIDIMKAYDTVNWVFLEKILEGFGFSGKFIIWIMTCVKFAAFLICVNGESFGYFKGVRGLRHGDPMSP